MNKEEMRKAFEKWLSSVIANHNVGGMSTGMPHFLSNFRAKQGAELAWQARQPEIDQLKAEIEKLKLDIIFIKEWSGYKDKSSKLKGEYNRFSGFGEQGEK